MAFIAQLNQWWKRLFDPNFESIKKEPRIFLINSHQVEDPQRVVSRFLLENLYIGKSTKVLDPRFFFIIHSKTKLWLWIGSQVPKANVDRYQEVANQTAKLLQEHERASKQLLTVRQGEEGAEFWVEFGLQGPPQNAY